LLTLPLALTLGGTHLLKLLTELVERWVWPRRSRRRLALLLLTLATRLWLTGLRLPRLRLGLLLLALATRLRLTGLRLTRLGLTRLGLTRLRLPRLRLGLLLLTLATRL